MRYGRVVPSAVGVILIWSLAACQVDRQETARALTPHSSWTCGMADGIPSPELGSLIFEVQMTLETVADVGQTPYGYRRIAVGQERTVSGPRLSGSVMSGALDLELTLSNGTTEVEQFLVLETTDGKYIYARNAGTGPDANDVRVVMDFEAPSESAHAWLNSGNYVARRVLDRVAKTLVLRVYDVSNIAIDSADAIRIAKPAGVPAQPWNYRTAVPGEKPGEPLITERVTLSPSQLVGASKRGNRNVIPITGGELSGRITGKVLMGGADYQSLSSPPLIDARYLWQADDGEIIIVRNVGDIGSLVPTFEARVDGPYGYLNTGLFLSSDPRMAEGGVEITMYHSAN